VRIWYYAIAGEESAPIAEDELVQMFARERLRESTLVWTEGLETWQPAAQFEIFFPTLEQEEDWRGSRQEEDHQKWEEDPTEWMPPVPPVSKKRDAAKESSSTSQELVRPWARFFARKIDIALGFMLLDWMFAFTGHGRFGTPFYQGVFLLLAFLALEPILLVLFGATPGKLVLGLQLHTRNGERITFRRASVRTLKVLGRGLAFGIPLLQIFAQLNSLRELQRDGETSWDREEGFVMEYYEFRFWRAVLTGVIVFALGVISVSFGLR